MRIRAVVRASCDFTLLAERVLSPVVAARYILHHCCGDLVLDLADGGGIYGLLDLCGFSNVLALEQAD